MPRTKELLGRLFAGDQSVLPGLCEGERMDEVEGEREEEDRADGAERGGKKGTRGRKKRRRKGGKMALTVGNLEVNRRPSSIHIF